LIRTRNHSWIIILFISFFLLGCQATSTQETTTSSTEPILYSIHIEDSLGGHVSINQATAEAGEEIHIQVMVEDCNTLQSLTVRMNQEDIPVINQTFFMPAGDVVITATFHIITCIPPYDEVEGEIWIEYEDLIYGFVGESTDFHYTLSHSEKAIRITSSDEEILTISNNQFHFVKPGLVMITIAYERLPYSRTFQITVYEKKPLEVEMIESIDRGGYHALQVVDPNDYYNQGVLFTSSDEMIATVSKQGMIFAHKNGTVDITITSKTTQAQVVMTIQIIPPKVTEIILSSIPSQLEVNQQIAVEANLLPIYSEGTLLGHSSNPNIIEILPDLTLVVKDITGEVQITYSLQEDPSLFQTYTITVYSPYTLQGFIDRIVNVPVMAKSITVYGYQFNYNHQLRGSIFPLYQGKNSVQDAIIPKGNRNRLGIIAPKHYIVIHDTGSSASSASEYAHAQYVRNPDTTVSWHYTVGADAIYRHLPDNEQGIHAGDGGRWYKLLDTNVPASRMNPIITVDAFGYYAMDGVSSTILAPMVGSRFARSSDLVDSGVRVVIGDNGNYFMGTTYYSGLSKIANTGGDKNGIGIEMTIHQGSDIFVAYQKLANHTASLLVLHQLTPEDVKQHNFFTGKNCPQTLRGAGYWDVFLEMVWVEYIAMRYFPSHTIEFVYQENDWVNSQGRLLRLPTTSISIPFGIQVSHHHEIIYSQSFTKIIH